MTKNVLYFSAPWCAPCKSFGPQFNAVMDERQDIGFSKIDIDKDFETAQQYGVRSIPTVVVLEDGAETGRASGSLNKEKLEQLLG